MNHRQSFLKVRLSSPIKLAALSAPKPTRFGGNGKASSNAIVLFSKKPNLILHIFSDFFLLNLTHATGIKWKVERSGTNPSCSLVLRSPASYIEPIGGSNSTVPQPRILYRALLVAKVRID